jgi:hypothetical protein
MSTIDLHVKAAARKTTRCSDRAAIDHLEVEWSGFVLGSTDAARKFEMWATIRSLLL